MVYSILLENNNNISAASTTKFDECKIVRFVTPGLQTKLRSLGKSRLSVILLIKDIFIYEHLWTSIHFLLFHGLDIFYFF